jgi:hypothetical protein
MNKRQPSGLWESLFGMLREVLIASMNKGQFPIAILGIVIVSFIWRIPSETVAKIAERAVDLVAAGWLAGYALSVFLLAGWFFHAKWQRKIINAEMKRLAAERTALQESALGRKLGTSKK